VAIKEGNGSSPAVPVWSSCVDIAVLGNCCIIISAIPSNITLMISLIIHNIVVHTQVLSAGALCLTQDELLQLITDIPALLPFKPFIDAIILVFHFIPADVLNICIDIYNVSNSNEHLSGCVDLNSTLICWKEKCLYKGTDQFGCFDIPIPALSEKVEAKVIAGVKVVPSVNNQVTIVDRQNQMPKLPRRRLRIKV